MNMNPNNDFDVNAQGVEVLANNGDLPSVLFDQDPFGDEDAKAEENNSPKRWRDQVAETATLLGITGSTRNKKFLIGGIGSAALLALVWSVPSMKESHVNKNSAAVIRKPASAKSTKAPFAKAAKSSGGGGDEGPLKLYELMGVGYCADLLAPEESDVLPFVSFDEVFSGSSACASKCTECVSVDGAVSGGSFRGFTFDNDIRACYCQVDVGATYNTGAGCTDGSYDDYFETFKGTGEILGVIGIGIEPGDVVCYKSKLPADLE